MPDATSRYVADIEIPEGIVSVDCEVRRGSPTEILLILNRYSCAEDGDPPAGGLRKSLESHGEILLETETDDPEGFLMKILRDAYGPLADISLAETDTD